MPDLAHTLQGHDLNYLKMVAGLWGVELTAPDARTALPELLQALLDAELAEEVIHALPDEAKSALQFLLDNEGKVIWEQFSRRFGEVRTFGAAARDRERPDLRPISPAEILSYRGLIGKAFLNVTETPQEYAYIPDDILELFLMIEPLAAVSLSAKPPGRPASPAEIAVPQPVTDRILDQSCTFLAALRAEIDPAARPTPPGAIPNQTLRDLLIAANVIDTGGKLSTENARAFLEAPRGQALAQLAAAWMSSKSFNDLRHVPGLTFEGEWRNNPLPARQSILELLSHVTQGSWWSIASFAAAVREMRPDFQRSGGDYDAWFIRKTGSDSYLRGFSAWDEVEGALIRFIITGPLHWLGIYDLAAPEPGAAPTAFRVSAWSEKLWHGIAPEGLAEENDKLKIQADGTLTVPRLLPRAVRYQIARFCEWLPPAKGEHQYRLTTASLDKAARQGLKVAHITALLRKNTAGAVPPILVQALENWEQHGVQAHIDRVTLLRVAAPELLTTLRSGRAARFLLEDLNPTTALVKPGAEEKLAQVLAESGYLAQVTFQPPVAEKTG